MQNEAEYFGNGGAFTKEDKQRTRNRLAQRRHRERKKGVGCSKSNENGSAQPSTTNPVKSSEPQSIPRPTAVGLTPSHSSWEGDDVHMMGPFDYDLANFSRPKKADAGRRSSSNMTSTFIAECNVNEEGMKGPAVGNDDMMAFMGEGYWQTYSNRDLMGIHSNKQEPQAHVGSIATQLVSPLEPGNSPNDTPDTSRRYFGNRASLVGPKRQDNHFISDNIRQQENSGQQQRGEHAEQAPSRSFAGLRRPALRNESITGHSRPTLEPMGQRDDDNDGDNDDDEDDDDDDDDDSRTESLEARLERVLNVVEDTGFDSIDSMALTYYTSEFSEDSTIHPMQSVSRTRRLRVLLSALQNSYKSWSGRGRSAYTEEMIRAAEAICSDELQALYGSKPQRRRRVSVASKTSYTNGNGPAQSNRNEIANRFRELLSSPEVADFIQKDKVVLKDLVPETWSMMLELARKAGVQPQDRAQIACISVYLLTNVPGQRTG